MYYATIIRVKTSGRVYIRFSPKKPDESGDVEVIDVLQHIDLAKLKSRAENYVSEKVLVKK